MVQKIDLIRQALSAAESSIKLARQLLSEIERDGVRNKPKSIELPGITGVFDGQDMVTDKGEKYPVPENYASKSILVVGDTLKLVEQGREKRFKQIEHVKRHKTIGVLAKKEGKWAAVTPEGSYKLLPASIEHYGAEIGSEVMVQIPANNLQSTWAAVERVSKKGEIKDKTEEKTISGEKGKEEKEKPAKESEEPRPKVKEERESHKLKPKPKAATIKSEKKSDSKPNQAQMTEGVQEATPTSSEIAEDELG